MLELHPPFPQPQPYVEPRKDSWTDVVLGYLGGKGGKIG